MRKGMPLRMQIADHAMLTGQHAHHTSVNIKQRRIRVVARQQTQQQLIEVHA